MIRAIRQTRLAPLLSVATLFCVVSLSASSLFHSDSDDAICNPELVVHDHTAHRVGGDTRTPPIDPEHCFICHWHSLRSVQTVVRLCAPVPERRPAASVVAAGLTSTTVNRQHARAPPLA